MRAGWVLFTGQHEHTIDAKKRLAIPAPIRARWRVEEHGQGWYSVPWVGGIIRLYPQKDFETRAKSGFLSLTPDEDEAKLQKILFGYAELLEEDSAGRIRLPEFQLALTKLPSEVVIVGTGDRLEISERAAWRHDFESNLGQIPELMARISAKKENQKN